jgi:transcription elongation factor Elf1
MLLSHIVPERQGFETRTFECPQCEHSEHVVAKVT